MLKQISHYKILRKLGSGGMGEVYFAEDERLSRKVALKILPEATGQDRKNLNRFLQEARLAANLNHPNICTIYEVSETEETPLLAMEMIEGETLAEKIKYSSLEIFDILRIATQIADALDEAHKRGVIHRDIKASNIIINHRGQVKVLDFGLAKAISEEVSEEDITRAKTEEGMLVGTVQYMSPEQALGKKLDGRTDLWSLGVLLYEMVCGTAPFRASTHAGVFDEILNKEPVPPSELAENLPEELEQIILKLLEKDVGLRYQTASDLLADLKRLRRNLGESFESSEIIPMTSSELRRSRSLPVKGKLWKTAALALLAVALLSGATLAIYKLMPEKTAEFSFANARPVRITSLGKVLDATVSDDGKYIAYVLNEGDKQSLWLKQTENGGTVRIIPDEVGIFQGIRISPDGNWLYYNIWDKKSVGQIFRIPVLGGIPQKVVHDCMPGVAISPDNKTIVFIRSDDDRKTMQLISAEIGKNDEKILYETAPQNGGVFAAVFAPDGRTLALIGYFPDPDIPDKYSAQIVEISVEGGPLKTIWKGSEESFGFASNPQWLPDKSGLLISLGNGEVYNQLFIVNYSDGRQTSISNDLSSYDTLGITADGKSFIGIQREFLLSVWTVPVNQPSEARRITDGKIEGVGVDWTPDGEIVYSSTVSGNFNLWKMKSDGSGKTQLTNDEFSNVSPCVTSDGKTILFSSNKKGARRMGIDGKEPKDDDWKRNVIWIGGECVRGENSSIYFSNDKKFFGLVKADLDTGRKTVILPINVQQAQISPNGKMVFFVYWDENEKHLASELIDLETKQRKPFSLPATAINTNNNSHYNFNWTPDSRNIAFVDNQDGVSNIWLYPVSGGKPRQLTDFKDNFIHSFSFSYDGKQIAVSRGTVLSDVVMFRNQK
ncbi:MAG: protein kinase [Pyrinomonadaceae bacterium]